MIKTLTKQTTQLSPIETFTNVHETVLWQANFNSQESITTYNTAVQQFFSFVGINTPDELQKITHAHVIAFKRHLQENSKSPRTINNRISAVSSLFNHLIDKQIVKINPAQGIKRMRVNNDRVGSKVLTPEQARRMLDAPNAPTLKEMRDRAVLYILFFTGCRESEVCKLQVKDYYEEQGFYLLDFWIKGGKRNRIAVNCELQVALNKYLQYAGHQDDKESPLILNVNPRQGFDSKRSLKRLQINRIWNKYAKLAGVEGSTPHSARATFITQALENNCDISSVQKSVGHSQIKTTQMYDKRVNNYRESASFAVRY